MIKPYQELVGLKIISTYILTCDHCGTLLKGWLDRVVTGNVVELLYHASEKAAPRWQIRSNDAICPTCWDHCFCWECGRVGRATWLGSGDDLRQDIVCSYCGVTRNIIPPDPDWMRL